MLQSLFYLTTALHISVVTVTHFQEHKTTVTTASGNGYAVLLSAAIVEELKLFVCVVRGVLVFMVFFFISKIFCTFTIMVLPLYFMPLIQ
jgi:hypothetical protein